MSKFSRNTTIETNFRYNYDKIAVVFCSCKLFVSIPNYNQNAQGPLRILNYSKTKCFAEKVCLAGVKSGNVKNSQITASSHWNRYAGHEAYIARLDGPRGWTPLHGRQSTTIV